MSIRAKSAIAFIVCCSVIAGVVSGVWINLNRESRLLALLNGDALGSVEQMSQEISASRADMYAYLATRELARAKDAHRHLDAFNRFMVTFQGTAAYRTSPGDVERNMARRSQDARNVLELASDQLVAQSTQSLPSLSQIAAYESAVVVAQRAADTLVAHERLEAEKKRRALLADVRRSQYLLLLSAAGGLALIAIMTILLSVWVTRPIRRLTEGVKHVSAGELDAVYPVGGNDEVGDLSRAFNEMRTRLRSAIDDMNREADERRNAEAQLAETNATLKRTVHQLESGADRSALISEMGTLLQSAVGPEEAHSIIAKYAGRILPDSSGRLLMLDANGETARTVASWGAGSTGRATFGHDQCWALRTGQQHTYQDSESDVPCVHMRRSEGPTVCTPLAARGETIGVLCISHPTRDACYPAEEQDLPKRVAERGAMAIADLRLRVALREQSIRDALTGLFNRRFMDEWLERTLAHSERESISVGVALLDIDHFKSINDAQGHEAGDKTLRDLGKFLNDGIRSGDVACRYGGDEFLLILANANREDTQARVESLCRNWNAHLSTRGDERDKPTLSVGVAVYPADSRTPDGLLAAADEALYRAKRAGGDRVMSFIDHTPGDPSGD